MKRIFVPTRSGSDWQRLLAKPELHWKQGRSAMTSAASWETAGDHLPPEISEAFDSSGQAELRNLHLLAALPEWEVPLPGGSRPSCTDVLAIASNSLGLCTIAVEAKAGEDFGPTLSERIGESIKDARIEFLRKLLGGNFYGHTRYQLMHRTASALLIGREFHAASTVMLVHSWHSKLEQRADFASFCNQMDGTPISDRVWCAKRFSAPKLYLAWCDGDATFSHVAYPPGL